MANQYIDMAITMDSTRNDLYREKADYYYYSGDYTQAIAMMDKYISFDPEAYFGY